MRKSEILKNAINYIEKLSKEKGLFVINKGAGHGFDNSIWENIFTDDSEIPHIIAKRKGFCAELRPFWSSIEISIRRDTDNGEELLVLIFSDIKEDGDSFIHTGKYYVSEVRCDSNGNYRKCINDIYEMIDEISCGYNG